MRAGRHIEVHGIVQGVGFRPWVYRIAHEEGVTGHVRNEPAGVTIDIFGTVEALDQFTTRLCSPPGAAEVRAVFATALPDRPVEGFAILPSETEGERRVSIPADLAVCDACVAEIFDRNDRRFRYPFTNCTHCGPRFTIAREAPYDRGATTMAAFAMCDACRAEYDDPANRRFHAQPNACPACGPTLALLTARGEILHHPDAIAAVAAAIDTGLIVAVKGIGGFHLACDATNQQAVRTLRSRKHRDEKPFAVMVRDLAEADRIADLMPADRTLLVSVERPIVIVRRRADSGLALDIAPHNPFVGLMLPYTPLHHLLLEDAARPLVMTSANLSDEPIVYENREAVVRLGSIADLLLVHDRGIETRCDDSVARVIAGRPVVLRRSRGYVPRPIAVSVPFTAPVLACGGLLKNTFCIGAGDSAVLGPHIGDLENLTAYESFCDSIDRMCRFLDIKPEVIAYDLHPDYLSTRYALERRDVFKVGVQHHHAHIASAMAEHGLAGPVLGVAYDGTGYGTDGNAWGSEVMIAREDTCDRVATFRPVALPGGDAAIRYPWRLALALLEDAFGGRAPLDVFPLFNARPLREVALVREMVARRLQSPMAHGAGRYFDGIGALALARPCAMYEGQIAFEWNVIADPTERGRYHFDVDTTRTPWMIDFRAMVENIARELLLDVPRGVISARFHNTLTAATVHVVQQTLETFGRMPVVLTGGCFQNARLAEDIATELSAHTSVYLHERVPPGDGGIALGQALVAGAVARRVMG